MNVLILRQEKPRWGWNHLHTQEIREITRIFNWKSSNKIINSFLQKHRDAPCNDNITNIEKQVYLVTKDEQRVVRLGVDEAC